MSDTLKHMVDAAACIEVFATKGAEHLEQYSSKDEGRPVKPLQLLAWIVTKMLHFKELIDEVD